MKTSIPKLRALKQKEKFSVVAAYDATFTYLLNDAGIDCILVGDSLGMVIQGQDSTLPVTIEHMVYHTEAVARANSSSLVIADMPFMSYSSVDTCLENAKRLMQAGANMVKLEGGAWLTESISQLVTQGIPVCGHLGLTPQSVNKFGGYKIQGRDTDGANTLVRDARALANAGVDFIVLECIPTALAKTITRDLPISTIGIGAGDGTDAQVLVAHDLLGMNPLPARFVRDFLEDEPSIKAAFAAFDRAVKNGEFPAAAHSYD